MKYKLLEHNNPESLSKEVELLLAEGWKLYGNPTSSIATAIRIYEAGTEVEVHTTYCQALIKE